VLEMRNCRPQTAQQPGQRPRHPPRLAAGGELDRLDTVRNALRVASHGREPELAVQLRQLAKQR
jgi:hypothetical protein